MHYWKHLSVIIIDHLCVKLWEQMNLIFCVQLCVNIFIWYSVYSPGPFLISVSCELFNGYNIITIKYTTGNATSASCKCFSIVLLIMDEYCHPVKTAPCLSPKKTILQSCPSFIRQCLVFIFVYPVDLVILQSCPLSTHS